HTGAWIVHNGQIPHTDVFSYTLQRHAWLTHEWLFAWMCFQSYTWGGWTGLFLLKQSFILLLASLLWVQFTTPRNLHSTPTHNLSYQLLQQLLILCVVLLSLQPFMILRASLLSSCGLLFCFTWLYNDRCLSRATTWVKIALLFTVWSNVHAGVLFGLLILLLLTTLSLLQWLLQRRTLHVIPHNQQEQPTFDSIQKQSTFYSTSEQSHPRGTPEHHTEEYNAQASWRSCLTQHPLPSLSASLGMLSLAFGCTLLNPHGFRVLLYPIQLRWFFYHSGIPFDLGIFAAPTPMRYPFFFALLGLSLSALLWKRRAWPTLHPFDVCLSLAFLVLALQSNRFITHVVLLSTTWQLPWFFQQSPRCFNDTNSSAQRVALSRNAVFGIALIVLMIWCVYEQRIRLWEPDLLQHFPQHATRVIQSHQLKGRFFHHQNQGGWFGWSTNNPVFWDGRNLLFAPLMKDFAHTKSLSTWFKRYRIDALLLNRDLFTRMNPWLRQHRDAWKLVYWDDQAAIYLHRKHPYLRRLSPSAPSTPNKQNLTPYTSLLPFAATPHFKQRAQHTIHSQRLYQELHRAHQQAPHAQLPLFLLGQHALYQKRYHKALRWLHKAAQVRPKATVFWTLAYVLQQLGHTQEARTWAQRAKQL
ncbi:MAG: tetratricopeptide repeat protein, partial [Myxococcota bacterium]